MPRGCRLAGLIKRPCDWVRRALGVLCLPGRYAVHTSHDACPARVTRIRSPVRPPADGDPPAPEGGGEPEVGRFTPGGERLRAPITLDELGVTLGELNMSLRRWFTSNLPHEVSLFIPHAELRVRRKRGTYETELVLESITMVHSPRLPVKARESAGRSDR